jgi:hypothetical protein
MSFCKSTGHHYLSNGMLEFLERGTQAEKKEYMNRACLLDMFLNWGKTLDDFHTLKLLIQRWFLLYCWSASICTNKKINT